MNEVDTTELWKSLVDVKHYLQYGIVEQTKSKTSFGADDALPIIATYRNFEKAKPYLSRELIEANSVRHTYWIEQIISRCSSVIG